MFGVIVSGRLVSLSHIFVSILVSVILVDVFIVRDVVAYYWSEFNWTPYTDKRWCFINLPS